MWVSTTPTSKEITITMISGAELLPKIQSTLTDLTFRTANRVIKTASSTHTTVRATSPLLRRGLVDAPEVGLLVLGISL